MSLRWLELSSPTKIVKRSIDCVAMNVTIRKKEMRKCVFNVTSTFPIFIQSYSAQSLWFNNKILICKDIQKQHCQSAGEERPYGSVEPVTKDPLNDMALFTFICGRDWKDCWTQVQLETLEKSQKSFWTSRLFQLPWLKDAPHKCQQWEVKEQSMSTATLRPMPMLESDFAVTGDSSRSDAYNVHSKQPPELRRRAKKSRSCCLSGT